MAFFAVSFWFLSHQYNTRVFAQNDHQSLKQPPVKSIDQFETVRNDPALKTAYENQKITNILVVGMESRRTDTLMVFSYNHEKNTLRILSVPRDTYVDFTGFTRSDRRKINAVYSYPDGKGGMLATVEAVSTVLDMPIDHYVQVDYQAVQEVVDALGGIEVEIPFVMDYDDPYSEPPLHIHFKKGSNTLDGADAVAYLRWRKNNANHPITGQDGGDLGRIERQQEFMQRLLKKAMNPIYMQKVLEAGMHYTQTSISFQEAMYYASKVLLIDPEQVSGSTVPGTERMKRGVWYFFPDKDKTKEWVRELYLGAESSSDQERTDDHETKAHP